MSDFSSMNNPSEDSPPGQQRPTIAYFVSSIKDYITYQGWLGVMDASRDTDVNLVTYVGSIIGGGAQPSQANIVYDIVDQERIDGIIIHGSAVLPSIDNFLVSAFLKHYYPLPLLSCADSLCDIPYVYVGRYQGIYDLVNHLIREHHYRRIFYFRGPQDNSAAEERFKGYLDALSDNGIAYDPNLTTLPLTEWQYSQQLFESGFNNLLNELQLKPGVDFQAIVADTDWLALTIMNCLRGRGIRIPEDVALVGCNNVSEGRFSYPPLTTVNLPFYQKAYLSMQMLLNVLQGKTIPAQTLLPSEVVIRQSCGCINPLAKEVAAILTEVSPLSGECIGDLLTPIRDALASRFGARILYWVSRLLKNTDDCLNNGMESSYQHSLEAILNEMLLEQISSDTIHNLISFIRQYVTRALGDNTTGLIHAENYWQQARIILGELVQRNQARQNLQRERQTEALHKIGQELTTTYDLEKLETILFEKLPGLGITGGYIVLYENPQPYQYPDPAPEFSRLIFGFTQSVRKSIPFDGIKFVTKQLLPQQIYPKGRTNFVVEPLFSQSDQIGYIIFEGETRDGVVYDFLRSHISSALRGIHLFAESLKAKAVAEKADRLKTRLLANVSHELRTPLNVIIGLADEAISATSTHENRSKMLVNDLNRIRKHAEHQLRVINDLLDLSRAEIGELDLYPELIDVYPLLEETFSSISQLSHGSVVWKKDLPDRLPVILADPVRLQQVLLNLVSNASKFVEQGEVVLGAEVQPPFLHLWVKDTGPGIPEKLQEQIFEPFITLEQTNRKFEGIGLGLSIARRLVALHHGILQLESKVGQGSTFHIYLPLPSLSGEKPLEFAERQALFVISSQENLSPEVLLLSNRQKLEVVRIGSIDVVENLLNQFQPTAVMWDLSQAKPTEWNIVRRLRNHPRLVDAAFILLNQNSLPAGESLRSISTFVLKHAKGQSLMDAINGLFSPEVQITVLIVDDDAHFIDLFVDVVRVALPGSRIMTASTGKQAIACMEETLPGLVILDLVMPEMDGFSVLDWIRGNDTTHNVPVIIMSNRLLTREDINRLENHAQVTLQTKGLLNKDEIAQQLFRTLFSTDTLPAYTSLLVKRVIGYMHQNYMCDFSRTALADEIGVSEDYLSRVFCREMGISPWDYLRRYRIFHAKVDLNRTSKSIESIAHQVGFSDPAYFSRVFRQVTGVSPRIYRNETDKSK